MNLRDLLARQLADSIDTFTTIASVHQTASGLFRVPVPCDALKAGQPHRRFCVKSLYRPARVVIDPLVEREPLKWTPRSNSDAAEYLRQKPEFSYSRIGGTAGTIFLRGLGGPRLGIVMNDSLEASAANHGTDPGTSYIQPDAHDHLTIVKDPTASCMVPASGGW